MGQELDTEGCWRGEGGQAGGGAGDAVSFPVFNTNTP